MAKNGIVSTRGTGSAFGGSLRASSGHSSSTTSHISSETNADVINLAHVL
jgi:hypothetical protein